MLFNSLEYGLFLVVVLAIYLVVNHRAQNFLLLIASYLFYGLWDYRFLTLIFASTFIDYLAAIWIDAARRQEKNGLARLAFAVSLVSNLGMLAFFKYYNFFIDSANQLLGTLGLPSSLPVLNIILPVGISFYTFQTLSYTIDVYRGELAARRNFLDFALFVSFFPQLVAGPIERASEFLPQVERPRIITRQHVSEGLYLIIIGLVRKVAIADSAGALADQFFEKPGDYSSIQLVAALILYSLQIYGDFAGYTDIARGSASLLGFRLMRNFAHPYFAIGFSDFWRRWHISLSTWLRDYLYVPLGGNRRGRGRTYANLLTTMLIGGLWHGASWNFVIWGALHGAYLAVERLWHDLRRPAETSSNANHATRRRPAPLPVRLLQMAATFAIVTFTWLFFRGGNMALISEFLTGLAQFSWSGEAILLPVAILTLLTLCIDVPQYLSDDEYVWLHFGPVTRGAFTATAVLLLIFSGNVGREAFIYFQF